MQSLEDIPAYFADFMGINLTTAQLILSIVVICTLLLPTMYLARGKNAPTIWLIMAFLGECIVLGLGWLPFWIMIMTITITALSIAIFGADAITGSGQFLSSEQKGFVIGVSFIILFAGLIGSIPNDLRGPEQIPTLATPINPSLVTDFEDFEDWNMTDLSAYDQYVYSLGSRDWVFSHYVGTIQLGAKVLIGGVLWLGQLDSCEFISPTGINRGPVLTATEIDEDADNGTVRYEMRYIVDGSAAGGFVVYWDTNSYTSSADAMLGDDCYFMHGVGITDSSTGDITALIIGLLLFQLPDVPPLINLLLATPIYASFAFILWFIIKETIPFV